MDGIHADACKRGFDRDIGSFVQAWIRSRLASGRLEGVFVPCSFRLVDSYILHGQHAKARNLFDRLLSRCNDVGLLAEEFDPRTGRMLGNFPQAYSHVGLINAALSMSRKMGPAKERAEPQQPQIGAATATAAGAG